MTAYGDILSSLEEFFEFCRTFGLQVGAEGGRFGVYRSCITQLSAELDSLRAGENQVDIYKKLRAELPRYLVALGESGEIREMLPFLRTCPPAELTPKLRALLSGPELPSEEDLATNQARTIQFELWLATVLWRGGAQIELAEPDLRCKIGEITIMLACKRVLSVKQLTKRINQAIKQVRQNLKSFAENASWGFVAISFSNLSGMEDSKVVKDRREALDRLESAIEKLINRRRPKWHQSREAQGIIFHAKAPFTNHETNRIEFGASLQLFGEGPVCETLAKLIGRNALH